MNPYLTIDSMAVPLTTFNGVEKQTDAAPTFDPVSKQNPTALVTLERGDSNPPQVSKRDLWHNDFVIPPSATITPLADTTSPAHIFKVQLQHTLGYINRAYDTVPLNGSTAPAHPTLDPQAGPTPKFYAGAPDSRASSPFPWLAWNNRPFANVAEIMLVPTSRSSQLAREFQPLDNLGGAAPNEYTQDTSPQQSYGTLNPVNVTPRYPYGSLLNFFFGSKTTDPATAVAPNFAQMLEYLQVPSPFVGTETVLDPAKFAFNTHIPPAPNGIGGPVAGESSMVQGGQEPDGTAGLHPPFNTVSNYRDPGKVNINTIADPSAGAVWNAIRGSVEYVEHDVRRPGVRRRCAQPPRLRQRGGAVPLRRQSSVDLFQSVPFARRRRHGAADRANGNRSAAKAGECQHLAGQRGDSR